MKRHAFLAALFPWICSNAVGQFVVHGPVPDSCLLPANSYVLWISDATEARIGEVYHANANTHVNAYLEGGTEEWIRAALRGPCSDTSRTDTIAISLTRLRCAESTAGTSVRLGVYLDLDVLHRIGTSWRVCYSATATKEEQCDNDDEERHERNILAALAECLDSFKVARDDGRLIDLPYRPEFASMPGDYPILHVPSLPKGIFRDLGAFRNATIEPVEDGSIIVDRNGKVRLYGSLVHKQDSIWALSDGSHFHLHVDKEFVRMNHNGDRYTTTIRRNAEQQGERTAIGVGFGAMGAMVTIPRKEEVRMRLDLATGLLVPVDDPVGATKANHIINLSHYVDAAATITVSHWDDRIALERDNYCELDFPVGSGAELVHVASARGDLWLALDNATPGTHFHLIGLDSSGVPEEKEVNPRLAEDMLSQLRPEMRRPAPVER